MKEETTTAAQPPINKPSMGWYRKTDIRIAFAPDRKDDGVYEEYRVDLGDSDELLGLRFRDGSGRIFCPGVDHPASGKFHGLTLDEAKIMAERQWAAYKHPSPMTEKPPLTLSALTEERAIQIAQLVYPFPEWVKSGYTYRYHENRPEIDYSDAYEGVWVDFEALYAGTLTCRFRVIIWDNLDVSITGYPDDPSKPRRFPVRNQRAIQKLFTEWGAE